MAKVLVLICAVTMAWAQDDLASDPYNLATLDALQSYAETPLCLRCATSRDLTQIPGISRSTAARIRRAADSSLTSIDDLAKQACLTTDQQVLISITSTLHCSCSQWFESGRLRLRGSWRTDAQPDWSGRLDLATASGRAGALVRSNEQQTLHGGWATVPLGGTTIALGDIAMAGGLGLVLGGGSGFGRSAASRLTTIGSSIRLRPYTSTWQDKLMRGIALHLSEQSWTLPLEVAGAWSGQQANGQPETSVLMSSRLTLEQGSVGLHMQHMNHSTISSVDLEVDVSSWTLQAELALNSAAQWAGLLVARRPTDRGTIVAAARWSHPDLQHPYAAPVSHTSSLGNETGLIIGIHHRTRQLQLEASLDVYGRLSKSYGLPMPTRGLDAIVDGRIQLQPGWDVDGRLRYEVDDISVVGAMLRRHRTTVRVDLSAQVGRWLRLRLRCDVRRALKEGGAMDSGYLAYADVRWMATSEVTLSARYTAYWSTSFDVAAYAMEVPVAGMFTSVVGSGAGTRLLLAATWQPVTSMRCSVVSVLLDSQTSAAAQLDIRI